jgi:hypothetical protein
MPDYEYDQKNHFLIMKIQRLNNNTRKPIQQSFSPETSEEIQKRVG